MLQNIRDRLTGPLVWFVVGLIAIPFAFWGIGTFDFSGGDPVVAKVGDQEITQGRFQQNFNQRFQQYRSLLGESFRADLFDESQFRRLTLDDMVQESAMRQFAVSEGYRAGDDTLRELLLEIPAFQSEGKFSKDAYLQVLQRQGLTPEQYEAQLRQSLVIDQLRSAVQSSAFATSEDVWQNYRLEKQVRSITAVPVAADNFRDKVVISDEQIKARFESEKGQHLSPERLKVKYIELSRANLPQTEVPADDVLKTIYEAEKESRFSTPEERKARHILIEFGDDKSKAREKAQGLVDQAREGADFAALAKENSSDPGSKDKGGDLGWVRKGVMVPEFEQALFEMKAGAVSDPVESEFGWHVIVLDQTREPTIRSFDDESVRNEILDVFRKRENETLFQDLSAQLELLAFENTELEPVAEKLGLDIQISDWMTRSGGEGIGAIEPVRTAAFAPEVLEAGENSKPIPATTDSLVVVHKAEHQPARQLPLEEVSDKIRETLISAGASKLAAETADAVINEVRAGKTLKEVAESRNLVIQFEGDAQRGQAELDANVAAGVFAMPRPEEGKVEVQSLAGSKGNVTVVALTAVKDPQKPEPGSDETSDEQRQVRESLAGAEFAAYQKAVEEAVSVKMINAPEVKSENPEF